MSASTALVLAFESCSFIARRNAVRHSVTLMVNTMYSSSAPKVMAANQPSNLADSSAMTSVISISVGRML